MVDTPMIWPGGKTMMIPYISKEIPPHKCRVELFGGGMAFTLSQPPCETEVYNDINSNIYSFWKCLRNDGTGRQLYSLLENTPYSRQEFHNCVEHIDWSVENRDIEWCRQYFVIINQGFTHEEDCTSFRSAKSHSVAKPLRNHVDDLPIVIDRLRNIILENYDFRRVIKNYDAKETFFFADPPYISEKGDKATQYADKMTLSDHIDLIQKLDTCEGQVMICGYNNELYEDLLVQPVWEKLSITRVAQVGNSDYDERETREECMWVKRHKNKPEKQKSHKNVKVHTPKFADWQQTTLDDFL